MPRHHSPSLIAFSRSDLTSSSGFLTFGGGFVSFGGLVIEGSFFGEDEVEFGREPFSLTRPFSEGGGGGGGGGGGAGAGAGATAIGGGGGGEGLSGTGGGGGRVSGSGWRRGELGSLAASTRDKSATRPFCCPPFMLRPASSVEGGGGGGGRLSRPLLPALPPRVGVPASCTGGGAGGGWLGRRWGVPAPPAPRPGDSAGEPGSGMYWWLRSNCTCRGQGVSRVERGMKRTVHREN